MLATALALAMLGQLSADALQTDKNVGPVTVEQTIWGLGNATSMTFNQVALQIRNDSDEIFEGTIAIEIDRSTTARTQPNDTVIRDLFLSVGETRWVTFGVFLVDGGTEWKAVTANREGKIVGQTPLAPPTFRDPVVLAITNEGNAARLPSLAASRFPTKATLLDGLHTVVITEAPRWQPGQERAFSQWLRSGGRALIPSDANSWPAELAELNQPLPEIRIGAGRAIRITQPVDELSTEAVLTLFRGESLTPWKNSTEAGRRRRTTIGAKKYAWDADGEVFLSLNSVATPLSLALLFYPMVVIYLVAIGIISWKSHDNRWLIKRYVLTLVGLVGVTTVAFAIASPMSGRMAGEFVSISFAIDFNDPWDDSAYAATNAVSKPTSGQTTPPSQKQSEATPVEEHVASNAKLPRFDLRTYTVYRTPLPRAIEISADDRDTIESRLVSIGSPQAQTVIHDGPSQTLTASVPGVTNLFLRSREVARLPAPRWKVSTLAPGGRLIPANHLARQFKPIAAIVQHGARIVRLDYSEQRSEFLVENSEWKGLDDFLVNPSMDPRTYSLTTLGLGNNSHVTDKGHILDAAGRAVPAFQQATGAVKPVDMTLPPQTYRLFVLTETPEQFQTLSPPLPVGQCYTVWCSQHAYQANTQ